MIDKPKVEDIDPAVKLEVIIDTRSHYDVKDNQCWVIDNEAKFCKNIDTFGDIDTYDVIEQDMYTTFKVDWPHYVDVDINIPLLKKHIAQMFVKHLVLKSY